MRLITSFFALVGVLAVISVGAMEQGYWPGKLQHPRIKRVIASIEMRSDASSANNVITAVCGRELNWLPLNWSPRKRRDVADDIRKKGIRYFLQCKDGKLADVLAFYTEDSKRWYIRTAPGSPCKFSDPDIPKNCAPSVN